MHLLKSQVIEAIKQHATQPNKLKFNTKYKTIKLFKMEECIPWKIQGVCHTTALQFTLKRYFFKAKEELWKFKYFTMQKYIIWSWRWKEIWHLKLDGWRSLTCGVGWKEEFDMWSWTENPFRIWTLGRGRAIAQAHSRRNSRECVGMLIPLVIVFVVSASSPQSRHRYSQQTAYLWALQAPVLCLMLFL